MNNPSETTLQNSIALIGKSDLFIFAAGFELRSKYLIEAVSTSKTNSILAINFKNGPRENLLGEGVAEHLRKKSKSESKLFKWISYHVNNALGFEDILWIALVESDFSGIKDICVDISGMPQFVIMEILASLRDSHPFANIEILFVAARSYPPSPAEITRFLKARDAKLLDRFEFGITFSPGEALCPKRFAGVGQRRGKSAMVLFAGYEKDRSHAAYDAVNPSKLILIHSMPKVEGARERLEYSRAVHSELGGEVDRSIEILDNLDVNGHVKLLSEYYEWLYDLYDLVLVPVHSKLQTIACFLFWETYPDVQVMFPVPIQYNSESGGIGIGNIYQFTLPRHPRLTLFAVSE